LTGFGAGAVDRASVAEQGREYDSSQDDSGGYRLGLENWRHFHSNFLIDRM